MARWARGEAVVPAPWPVPHRAAPAAAEAARPCDPSHPLPGRTACDPPGRPAYDPVRGRASPASGPWRLRGPSRAARHGAADQPGAGPREAGRTPASCARGGSGGTGTRTGRAPPAWRPWPVAWPAWRRPAPRQLRSAPAGGIRRGWPRSAGRMRPSPPELRAVRRTARPTPVHRRPRTGLGRCRSRRPGRLPTEISAMSVLRPIRWQPPASRPACWRGGLRSCRDRGARRCGTTRPASPPTAGQPQGRNSATAGPPRSHPPGQPSWSPRGRSRC